MTFHYSFFENVTVCFNAWARLVPTIKFSSWICSLNLLFKRNANAFSLNTIIDVRLRRRHEMIFEYLQKLLKLAASKYYIA